MQGFISEANYYRSQEKFFVNNAYKYSVNGLYRLINQQKNVFGILNP